MEVDTTMEVTQRRQCSIWGRGHTHICKLSEIPLKPNWDTRCFPIWLQLDRCHRGWEIYPYQITHQGKKEGVILTHTKNTITVFKYEWQSWAQFWILWDLIQFYFRRNLNRLQLIVSTLYCSNQILKADMTPLFRNTCVMALGEVQGNYSKHWAQ